MDPIETVEILSRMRQHTIRIHCGARGHGSIQPKGTRLLARQFVPLAHRLYDISAHTSMHGRALARKAAAVAEIHDVLAGHAKQPRGHSRRHKLWRPSHDGKDSLKTPETQRILFSVRGPIPIQADLCRPDLCLSAADFCLSRRECQ